MKTATSGAGLTPQKTEENQRNSINKLDVLTQKGLPRCLNGFFESARGEIRFTTRDDGRRAGVMTIPDIHFPAWKTRMPKSMIRSVQNRYKYYRRFFFEVVDMPVNAPLGIITAEEKYFFTGYMRSMPAGEWVGKAPAELPQVPYCDILTGREKE
ncbi:MAG TPA: hypothetical protein O0X38_06705 [Methanocorpusculum sp.]|nr:hypothetical protein [Methanocorpusculum sp.]